MPKEGEDGREGGQGPARRPRSGKSQNAPTPSSTPSDVLLPSPALYTIPGPSTQERTDFLVGGTLPLVCSWLTPRPAGVHRAKRSCGPRPRASHGRARLSVLVIRKERKRKYQKMLVRYGKRGISCQSCVARSRLTPSLPPSLQPPAYLLQPPPHLPLPPHQICHRLLLLKNGLPRRQHYLGLLVRVPQGQFLVRDRLLLVVEGVLDAPRARQPVPGAGPAQGTFVHGRACVVYVVCVE